MERDISVFERNVIIKQREKFKLELQMSFVPEHWQVIALEAFDKATNE